MWDIIFAFPAASRSLVYKYFYTLNHGPNPEQGMKDIKVNKHIPCHLGAHGPMKGKGKKQVIYNSGVRATGRVKSGAAGT